MRHLIDKSVTSRPKRWSLLSDRSESEKVKPGDIVYIPVTIEDENGVVEFNADRRITLRVEGGELLAFGSANPCTEEQYRTGTFTTCYGRALAVVRAGEAGTMRIRAADDTGAAATEIAIWQE